MPRQSLEDALRRVRRRLAVSAVLDRTAALCTGAFLLSILYAAATKLIPGLPGADSVGFVLVAAAVAVAGTWVAFRRPDLMEAAVCADRALGLKERLSSAYALRTQAERDPMVAALVTDAETRAASLEARAAFPFRWPRRSRGAALAGMCFLGVLLVPQLSWFMKPEQRALRTEEQRQSKKLKTLAKKIERVEHKSSTAERRKLAQRLKSLAKEMKRGELSKADALKRFRQLTKEAEELQRKLAAANTLRPAAEALANLKNAIAPDQSGASLPQSLKQALGELGRRLQRGQLSPADQKRLAEALQRAAEALRQSGQTEAAQSLAEAAKQLQAGNLSGAAAALGEAMLGLENALAGLEADELSAEALAELMDGRLDLALADNTCPDCGNPSALCTCENCGFG